MKAKAIGLALALGCGVFATSALTASAAPVSGSALGVTAGHSGVEQVQYKKRNMKRFNRSYRHSHRAGSRHSHAPRNWRRYDSRPGDWSRRGCIIVGPLWYCP